jgi:hypothetical protein
MHKRYQTQQCFVTARDKKIILRIEYSQRDQICVMIDQKVKIEVPSDQLVSRTSSGTVQLNFSKRSERGSQSDLPDAASGKSSELHVLPGNATHPQT